MSKLKKCLKEKDLNASQLARRCGVSPQLAWRWVHGSSKPKFSQMEKIAKALNMTIEETARVFTEEGD